MGKNFSNRKSKNEPLTGLDLDMVKYAFIKLVVLCINFYHGHFVLI